MAVGACRFFVEICDRKTSPGTSVPAAAIDAPPLYTYTYDVDIHLQRRRTSRVEESRLLAPSPDSFHRSQHPGTPPSIWGCRFCLPAEGILYCGTKFSHPRVGESTRPRKDTTKHDATLQHHRIGGSSLPQSQRPPLARCQTARASGEFLVSGIRCYGFGFIFLREGSLRP